MNTKKYATILNRIQYSQNKTSQRTGEKILSLINRKIPLLHCTLALITEMMVSNDIFNHQEPQANWINYISMETRYLGLTLHEKKSLDEIVLHPLQSRLENLQRWAFCQIFREFVPGINPSCCIKNLLSGWKLSWCNLDCFSLFFFHLIPCEERAFTLFETTLEILECCDEVPPEEKRKCLTP